MGNVCSGNASKSGFLTFSWCSKSAIAPKDDKKESSKNGKKEESSKDNKKEESSKDSKKEESSRDVKKEPSNGDEVGCKETEVVAIHEKPPEPMKMAREEAVQKEEPTKPVEEAKVKLEPKRQPTRLSSKQAARSTALNEENKSSVREKPASQSSRFNEENNPSKPEKPASQSSRFNEENKPSETEKPASLSPRFHGENKPSEPEKPASQSSRFHEESKPSELEKPASLSPRFHEENKPSDPEKPASQSSRFHEENKPLEPEKPKKPKHEKRSSCAGLQVEFILQTKTGHLKEYYELGKKLGHGQFGTTFLCVEKGTGKEYACKSIAKRKLVTEDDVDDVKREIQIMHHLAGHPNVVSIRAAYEDSVAVHVVMELCTGGELFDRIIKKGHYTESKAAGLTRTIVGVIESCHSMGVMHRDLKPENFLFVNEDEDSSLKAIDFGLSIFFKPGDIFKDVVGSPYYVAPEVLKKRYGPEADVWSAGVILYILLSGVPPFWGETEKEIFDEVFHGQLDFKSDPWPKISESAKDLIRKMLVRDPKKRISAHEVLCDPWVQVDGVAPDKPLDSIVLSRLKQFSAMNKLKKMALRVIAQRLSEDEIAGLKEIFKMIDTDNSGQITFEELKEGLKRFGADLNETEFHDLMQAVDVDKSGTIDYAEFVAATLHLNKVEKEEHLFAAFSYFDKDGSGYITQDELQQACQEFGIEDVQLEEMIQDADQDNDGRIDYNEFVAMMQKGNAEWGKKELQDTNFGIGFRETSPVS